MAAPSHSEPFTSPNGVKCYIVGREYDGAVTVRVNANLVSLQIRHVPPGTDPRESK